MSPTSRIITQGHRGARGAVPENTLAGVDYAIHAGVDRIEIDINLSADNHLLVVHDETTHPDLVRAADGAWVATRIPWRDLNLDTIRRFDVGRIRPGSDYARRFPHQRAMDGEGIPLLEEVAARILAHHACSLNIEIKCDPNTPAPRPDADDFAQPLVALIHRLELAARVTVQSFNWNVVAAVQAIDPGLVTGCLTSESRDFDTIGRERPAPSPWTHGLCIADFNGSLPAMVRAMQVDYWSSDYRDLTVHGIEEAHDLDLAVHCWTVNDPEDMKRLISWGVDSIITDYPDILLEVLDTNPRT